MVSQKEVNLNVPLDVNKKATLSRTELTPDLAEASLVLHGDYYRQLQGKCNKYLFWHPLSLLILISGGLSFFFFRVREWIEVADSAGEFFKFFVKSRDFQVEIFKTLPLAISVFGIIAVIAFMLSDVFRVISDELPKPEYSQALYGFDITKFANSGDKKLTPKEKAAFHGDYTQIIVYRDSPIAVVTLRPLLDVSTESNFVVRITGLHVRKVFAKADFETLMLEWSFTKARQIFQEHVKKSKVAGCKIQLLIDAYSFDKHYINALTKNSFGKVSSSYVLNPMVARETKMSHKSVTSQDFLTRIYSMLTHKVFNISRDTYGVTITAMNDEDDLLLKEASKFKAKEDNSHNVKRRNYRPRN